MQRNDLVGAWRLVSSTARDEKGRERQTAGADPFGLILYTPDGYMSASIAYGGRSRSPEMGAAEKVAAYDSYLTYAGPWEIEGEEVLHHIQVSVNPNLVGTTMHRRASLDGTRLTLTTPPTPAKDGSAIWVSEIVWERAG